MSSPSPDFQLFTSVRYDPLLHKIPSNTASWPTPSIPSSSPFYILPHHRDRILQAATHFNWTHAAASISGSLGFDRLLHQLQAAIPKDAHTPLRVRVLLGHDGTLSVETSPVPPTTEFNLFPARLPPPRDSISPPKVSPLTGGTLELGHDDSVHGDPPSSSPWDVTPNTERTIPSRHTSYKTTSRDVYNSARDHVGITGFTEQREVLIVSAKGGEIMEGSLTTVFFWRDGQWVTPGVESGGQIGTTRRWALDNKLCVEGAVTVDDLVDGEECWISNGVRGFQCGRIRLQK